MIRAIIFGVGVVVGAFGVLCYLAYKFKDFM